MIREGGEMFGQKVDAGREDTNEKKSGKMQPTEGAFALRYSKSDRNEKYWISDRYHEKPIIKDESLGVDGV